MKTEKTSTLRNCATKVRTISPCPLLASSLGAGIGAALGIMVLLILSILFSPFIYWIKSYPGDPFQNFDMMHFAIIPIISAVAFLMFFTPGLIATIILLFVRLITRPWRAKTA